MKLTAENSKGEKMKYRLARSMKECMKTMSVDNITVKQITENCGVTRQTFYRNFMDKFDLINWYFDKILLEILYLIFDYPYKYYTFKHFEV